MRGHRGPLCCTALVRIAAKSLILLTFTVRNGTFWVPYGTVFFGRSPPPCEVEQRPQLSAPGFEAGGAVFFKIGTMPPIGMLFSPLAAPAH